MEIQICKIDRQRTPSLKGYSMELLKICWYFTNTLLSETKGLGKKVSGKSSGNLD